MKRYLQGITKLIISVVIFGICFFRNQIFNPETETGKNSLTVLSVIAIVVSFKILFSGLIELFDPLYGKKVVRGADGTVKKWTKEELYSFLEKETMIDIVVKYENSTYNIGVISDIRTQRWRIRYIHSKDYYIGDKKYTSIEDFKREFDEIYKDDLAFYIKQVIGLEKL